MRYAATTTPKPFTTATSSPFFLNCPANSFEFLKTVEAPIRIFHGTEDRVVPYESGKKLFESIPSSDKKIYTVPGGRHNNLEEFEIYRNGLKSELTD